LTTDYFTKNNMTLVPHPPYSPDIALCDISPFPQLKIKLIHHCTDPTEVIGAELQGALNTTSRIHLKNGKITGNGAYTQKGTT
jgi:hypothetical protein